MKSGEVLEPLSYLKSANQLIEQGKVEEAAALYEQAALLYPDNARIYRALGTFQRQQGNIDGAIASYRKAIELQPEGSAEIYLTLGQILLDHAQLAQAVEVYQAALKFYPNDALIHRFLGLAQRKQGDTRAAIAAYCQSLNLSPEQPARIYLTLGQLLVEQNLLDEAVEFYGRATEYHRDNAEIYRSLAIIQGKRGDTSQEIANYLEVIRLEPQQPIWVYLNLGSGLFKAGQIEEAIELYQRGIKLYPNKADLYRALGFAQEKSGDLEAGIASYQKAIELRADQPAWLYLILAHLLTDRDSAAAIEVCKALAKIDPTAYEAHQKIINILLDEQKFDDVFAYIEQSIPDEFSNKASLVICGHNLLRKNQTAQAEVFFERVVEKYPDSYEGYEGLALVCETLKRDQPAKQYWRECFSRFEQHPLRSSKDISLEPGWETGSNAETSNAETASAPAKPEKTAKPQRASAVSVPVSLCPELDNAAFVEFCFTKLLHRKPPQHVVERNISLLNTRSRSDYLAQLLNGEEAKQKRRLGVDLLSDYSDEEFVEFIVATLFGIKASKPFQENLLRSLGQGNLRSTLALRLLEDQRLKDNAERIIQSDQPSQYYMVGKKEALRVDDWYRKFAENARDYLLPDQQSQRATRQQISLRSLLAEPHWPLVSIITSLYNGDEFIEHFMQHICEQSIFLHDCELIIIDANSPGNEYECIKKYCEKYKNISYYRFDEKITIYEAWNIAAQKAKGLFLTNANLDDVKRFDCLELQARELIANPTIDIVYSDYAYSLEPNLPFELVCLEGHQTSLPVADAENLLLFNSPHCGPMWRKSLHDSLGLFDDSFKSAGDMELWIRASLSGHKFGKIEQTLIAYYLNPKGLSTDHDGVGREEGLRVIQKYQNLQPAQTNQNDGIIAPTTVKVLLNQGQEVDILLPDNKFPIKQGTGGSSYFAFSIYKAGSTLLTRILQMALEYPDKARPTVNMSKQLFTAGIDGKDWMFDENLNQVVVPGYYHIGFREYAPFLEKNPVFRKSKKVLLIRDPRDVLVSYYYSVLKSHTITQGDFGKSQQEFREQVQSIDIDSFVQEQSSWIKGIYEAYMASSSVNKHLRVYRYEEVVFDKANWINNLLDYLEIDISIARKRFILNEVNVIPKDEDTSRHIRNVVPGDHARKLQDSTIKVLNQELEKVLRHFNYLL